MVRAQSVLALALASGLLFVLGCAAVEYRYVGVEPLKNENGHVIGQREKLRDVRTGEEVEHFVYFTPRLDSKGTVIGYEEPARSGTVLRDLDGRRVGLRYTDLRSRDTNPKGEGVTVIVTP